MREKLNPEGLTFEEWVYAAGLAKHDCDGCFRPYQETRWREVEYDAFYKLPIAVRTRLYSRRGGRWVSYRARPLYHVRYWAYPERRINYPLRLRKAWAAGEDPAEYRGQEEAA